MSDINNDTFLVHIPDSGTEPLSKEEICLRIKDGRFSDSILLWNDQEQDWRPAHTFPWLKKTTPLPTAAVIDEIRNRSIIQSKAISNAIQQEKTVRESDAPDKPKPKTQSFVARPPSRSNIPANLVVGGEKPEEKAIISKALQQKEGRSSSQVPVSGAAGEHPRGSSFFRMPAWVYPLLGISPFILLLLIDWWSIGRQVNSVFTKYDLYKNIKPIAHYQYHLNPNVLVVDLDDLNSNMSPESFIDTLTVLAKIKDESWTGSLFQSIQLRKGGSVQYIIKGVTWKELASLYDESAGTRAAFLMRNIEENGGKPLIAENTDETKKSLAMSVQAFSKFCNTFWKVNVTDNIFRESAAP